MRAARGLLIPAGMGDFLHRAINSATPWESHGDRPDDMTNEELAHAAVLEQMSHGATYRDDATARSDPNGQERQTMLITNGYNPCPETIVGEDGFAMTIYRPLPGRERDVAPVVSFRGSDDMDDVVADVDPVQVGNEQYERNRRLIDAAIDRASQGGTVEVEMTGHSLGGGLAQRAAAEHPDAAGHITTFQAPGMDEEEVARIEEWNRAHPHDQIVADHYRVEGDAVPLAGEGHAPGTVHHIDRENEIAGVEMPYEDFYSAHTAHPVTQLALQTEEGRRALPNIAMPDEARPVSVRENSVANEEDLGVSELVRSQIGTGVAAARDLARAHRDDIDAPNAMVDVAMTGVDLEQAMVDNGAALANGTVDRTQAAVEQTRQVVGGTARRASRAVDRAQDAVGGNVAAANLTVDVAQSQLGLGSTADRAVDTAQDVIGGAVQTGQSAVDTAQRLGARGATIVGGAVETGQHAIDAGQRSVNGVVASGQRVVERGQQAVRSAQRTANEVWDWIAT